MKNRRDVIQIGQYLIKGTDCKVIADTIATFLSNKSYKLKEARYQVNGKTIVVKVRPV